MKPFDFSIVDLFCGAGGSGTGAKLAADKAGISLSMLAINHWVTALRSHEINHPWAQHLPASVNGLNYRTSIPGRPDMLVAGPECTNHSDAKGDKEINDQSRASAWAVVDCIEQKRPKWLLVENVPAFLRYGPLGANNRPLKSRRGERFMLWFNAIKSLGYTLEWRRLVAANYGAFTTRERLFVMGRYDGSRSKGPLPWPKQTHAPAETAAQLGLQPWRQAREIIDFSLKGRSIFDRPDPLAENTLRRIAAGAAKFWHVDLEPFLIVLRRNADARSLDLPLPAVTTSGNHFGIVEPFVLGQHSGSIARQVSLPLPTIACGGAISVIEPFLISYYGTTNVSSVLQPMPTVTTRDRFGLIQRHGLSDITLRMLVSRELARGQGFPDSYQFAGNDREVKAQIGNAWEVTAATALFSSIFAEHFGFEEERAA